SISPLLLTTYQTRIGRCVPTAKKDTHRPGLTPALILRAGTVAASIVRQAFVAKSRHTGLEIINVWIHTQGSWLEILAQSITEHRPTSSPPRILAGGRAGRSRGAGHACQPHNRHL